MTEHYDDRYLGLAEEFGRTGRWYWSFASGEQFWSTGLFRIVGRLPHSVAASYNLLLSLLHPNDRTKLASPGEISQGFVLPKAIVRLIRPSGEMLILSIVTDIRVDHEGRPLSAGGLVLDITDQERMTQIRAQHRQQRNALYLSHRVGTYFVSTEGQRDFPDTLEVVHGHSILEIEKDPLILLVPEEREAVRDRVSHHRVFQSPMQLTAHYRLANGEIWNFRLLAAPVWNDDGRLTGATGAWYPIHDSGAPVHPHGVPNDHTLRRALEQMVQGYHLRAARALLDWSRATLAEASGISATTLRRLEENGEAIGARSRHKVVAALRSAGVKFVTMDNGAIAVVKI